MKTVNIINLQNNENYLTLVDGLNLDDIKTRYNWLFNARINNAIVGENDNGLVWYTGDWYCGEWYNGTWYGGTWYNGTWYNGTWYSYLLDRYEIINGNFSILDKNNTYSKFLNGNWYSGQFNGGTFGDDTISITGYTYEQIYEGINCATWYDGDFIKGVLKNSIWFNGNFYNGLNESSQWLYGNFFNGIFNMGIWWDGKWFGGDFTRGTWKNGYFTVKNNNVMSRFGYNTDPESGTTSIWENGIFENGEFYSGYKSNMKKEKRIYVKIPENRIISSNDAHIELEGINTSNNHNRTHWLSGDFKNGYWYGGTFHSGKWYNGVWYNGVFSGSTIDSSIWYNGYWYDGLWINGTFKDGYWYGGMWLDGEFDNGDILS